MLIDIHGDIFTDVVIKRLEGKTNIIRDYHLDRFKKGEMTGGIFIVWADPPYDKKPRQRLLETVRCMASELFEARNIVKVVYKSGDFEKAKSQNKLGVILGLEGLSGIEGNINEMDFLYQLGFRHAGLTWNEENELATGVLGNPDRGLSKAGFKAVKRINDLGMILDVSHANDKSFWDIAKTTNMPIIASHSNARALCPHKRNLTDEMIKEIAKLDGLIGMNAFRDFVDENKNQQTLERLIDHLEHIAGIAGVDKVALGFDFFDYLSGDTTDSFTSTETFAIKGLEDISHSRNLIKVLKARGFSQEDIDKITHKNFLSIVERILK